LNVAHQHINRLQHGGGGAVGVAIQAEDRQAGAGIGPRGDLFRVGSGAREAVLRREQRRQVHLGRRREDPVGAVELAIDGARIGHQSHALPSQHLETVVGQDFQAR